MADYTLVLADLATGTPRGRYRVSGLRFSRELNGIGTFDATFHYADLRTLLKDPIGSSTLAKTAIYIERNESQIVWGGIAWQRRRSSRDKGQFQLSGSGFEAYLSRRNIVDTLSFTNQDQLAIARDLVAYAQGDAMNVVDGHPVTIAKPGGDLGITYGSETSGVLRTILYEGSDGKLLGEALDRLAQLDDGFDWSIESAYSAGIGSAITRALQLYYPRSGRPAPQSTLRWEMGSQMTDYTWPEDATGIATTSYAFGSGEGAGMLRSSASAQYLIDAGFPLLEAVRSYKDETVQATLDAHARADSIADGVPSTTLPTITVRGEVSPVLGSYVLGDEGLVVIDDENFPGPRVAPLTGGLTADNSISQYVRIQGWEVTVDENGVEFVDLHLGPVLA